MISLVTGHHGTPNEILLNGARPSGLRLLASLALEWEAWGPPGLLVRFVELPFIGLLARDLSQVTIIRKPLLFAKEPYCVT